MANNLYDHILVADFVEPIFEHEYWHAPRNAGRECIAGTVGYQAPEMIISANCDKPVDVWSIGCIVYTCCSLKPPFGYLNGGDVKFDARCYDERRNVTGNFTPMEGKRWQAVHPAIIDLIGQMLTVDPAARITVQEILENDFVRSHCTPAILSVYPML